MDGAAKTLKAVRRLLLTTFGLALGLYLLLAFLNLHDQPASPQATVYRQLHAQLPPVADQDNGYLYMLGFAAARAGDPEQEGRRLRALLARYEADPVFAREHLAASPSLDLYRRRNDVTRAVSRDCNFAGPSCPLYRNREADALTAWLADEHWLLERYLALLQRTAWRERAPVDLMAPFPPYADVAEGQKLLLAHAWQHAAAGDTGAARTLLEQDARFWRRALAESDLLITKMVVVAAIQRHLFWSNEISRRSPAMQASQVLARDWQHAISARERSLLRVLGGEWMFSDRLFREMDGSNERLLLYERDSPKQWLDFMLWQPQRLLYQPQDTSNRHAQMLRDVADALEVSYTAYPAALVRASRIGSEHIAGSRGLHFYNPVGRLMLRAQVPIYHEYGARTADLEGLRLAVLAAADLRSRSVPPEQVATALAESVLRNPYTAAPFTWDAGEGSIIFKGLEAGERGLHRIPY